MPLVGSKEILAKAQKEKYAVGAFNANNLEQVQAIIESAEEESAPVFLQASQGAIKYAGLNNIVAIVRNMADSAKVPVVLHLDHGTSFEENVKCFRMGFTSLMFDGSKLPFEKNVAITKKVAEVAHSVGLTVEGEIGRIPGTESHTLEEIKKMLTDPDEAARFVQESSVDSIAIAVGSLHRMKEKVATLDHERIVKIASLTSVPLVLHGSSGVMDSEMQKGIQEGLCKINVATLLNIAFVDGIKQGITELPDESDPRKILGYGKSKVKEMVRDRIRCFGSSGKA